MKAYTYHNGFGAYVSSEALPEVLPKAQNSPQICPYGLYAEQLSGSAFTAPRAKNERSWLYKIHPSAKAASAFNKSEVSFELNSFVIEPVPLRWNPADLTAVAENITFIDGLHMVCGAGDPSLKSGLCIYTYAASTSMENQAFYNSDGDFLIVPQAGALDIITEFGRMLVEPCEIAVIPRGIKFSIHLINGERIRGYVLEVFEGHFELPGLGPIGANGLANPRDFEIPVSWYEDRDVTTEGSSFRYNVLNKYMGKVFTLQLNYSPFNVVGWHGNYYPYKYDLRKFNCINSVTFDHPDPSIYTVLTCPSSEPGVAVADFVIFPPRWMVAEHTFRPPYYHRNCMSEYMGMIYGKYDAKEAGFVPGGASLHSAMTPHGPDSATFRKASTDDLKPVYLDAGLAFMFESTYMMKVAPGALACGVQEDYWECWSDLPKLFNGSKDAKF